MEQRLAPRSRLMAKKPKPRARDLPGMVVTALRLYPARLEFARRKKPTNGRRWAVSCPTLWEYSVHIDDAMLLSILNSVLEYAEIEAAKGNNVLFRRDYVIGTVLERALGRPQNMPAVLYAEIVEPWMKKNRVDWWG